MIFKPVLKNRFYLYFSFLFTILIMICISYFSTLYIEKNVKTKILEISTNDIFEIINNTSQEIKEILVNNKKDFNLLVNNDIHNKENQFFKLLDKKVETLITKNIKYAYLLYIDKNNFFRFIADASKGEEKAKLNEKFDIDSQTWLDAYTSQTPALIKHEFSDELFITYLKPIVIEDKTVIFAIDFSIKKIDEISSTIFLIKIFLLSLWVLVLSLFLILLYQTFRFYTAKKTFYIDRLTGVYSRNYLQDYEMFLDLKDYILCAIDVDYFKKVNDTYGHIVGDNILIQITKTIKNEIRNNKDIFIRYGGEEFCLLIKKDNSNNDEFAINVIKRIHNAFKNKQFIISDKEEISITISIGVNLLPHNQRDFISAFKLADIALYNAKNNGRNSIEIYQERKEDEQFLTIDEIEEAIQKNMIICHYQEIINENKDSQTKHYEALLRVIKNNQIYLPEKFMTTIKDTFIATKLTKELLKIIYNKLENCDLDLLISVNLTPQDLQNQSIITILKSYSKQKNITSKIALEIVETEEIINYESTTKTIIELKELGYKIYIDDFGSGYSNFIYLAKIKADAIKIDGSIISTINSDKLSYLVAKNIVNFAKEAQIEVIAEHVSTKEIYDTVKALGINKFQGFYFSKPIT